MGANTAAFYYIDTPAVKAACKDDFEKINKACKPEKEKSDKNQHPALKKMLGAKRVAKLEEMANALKNKKTTRKDGSIDDSYQKNSAPTDKNAWMEHCDGLWIKPDGGAEFKEQMDEFNNMLQDMSGDISSAIKDQIKPALERAAAEAAAERLVKGALTRNIPRIGKLLKIKDAAEAAQMAADSKRAIDIATQAQRELEDLAKGVPKKRSPTDLMAEGMGVLSRLNPCTRARRCLLVPYKNSKNPASLLGEGCCPGQSGHHVIPEESAGSCDNYSHDNAPTMCVEGTNNGNGTHGKAHDALLKQVEEYKQGGWFDKVDKLWGGSRDTASYGKMRDMGIDSVQKTFPESKCDTKCLQAQLDAYYKDKCKKAMPAAAGKKPSRNGSTSTKPTI